MKKLLLQLESEETVGVLHSKLEDGPESLFIFIALGNWSTNCTLLYHISITWLTRSLYAGQRLVTFTPHIEDVFATNIHIDNINLSYSKEYRSTVEDFQILEKWQNDIVDELPEGSFIKSDLAFVGYGIVNAIDPSLKYFKLDDYKRYCSGYRILNENKVVDDYVFPYDKEYLEKDDLFAYFEKEENNKNFFWTSHTFDHNDFSWTYFEDVVNTIKANNEIAKLLGIYDKSNFSSKSLITPYNSGFSIDKTSGYLRKIGILYSATSGYCSGYYNKENPYLPYYPLDDVGDDSIVIVPRISPEIYFCATDEDENVRYYNTSVYSMYKNTTFDQIIEREAGRISNSMINLKNDPYEFHQTNIRSHDLEDKKSLLQKWGTAALKKYASYVDWPVISLKLDDLAQLYENKYNRVHFCDINISAVIEGDSITAVKVEPKSMTKNCKIPITVPEEVYQDDDDKITYERIGKDRLVAWISFEKDDSEAKLIKLNPPLAWINNANVNQEVNQEEENVEVYPEETEEVYQEDIYQEEIYPEETEEVY